MLIDTMEFNNQFSPMGIQNFYIGEVVDNLDPKKLGRVRVSIPEIFGAAGNDDLPWTTSFMDSPHEFNCPEVGDKLVIFFPYGVVYFPCYIGHWHITTNHDDAFDADYPNTIGFNRQGFSVLYNKTSKVLTVSHPSGANVSINADGEVFFDAVKKFTVDATGEISFITTDKISMKADGDISYESEGEATFKGKSKTTIGDDASQTFVNGTQIILAKGGAGVAVLGSQTIAIGNLGIPVIGTVITSSSKVFAPL